MLGPISGDVLLNLQTWRYFEETTMTNDATEPLPDTSEAPGQPKKQLTPEAQRALVEAEVRRQEARKTKAAKEIGGREGPDPVRFGDWEIGGIVSDF